MTGEPPETVSELVARFQLRQRADASEFAAGVRLARQDAVSWQQVTDARVRAAVQDKDLQHVELWSEGAGIGGRCGCGLPTDPCRHQVAVAHALWTADRESRADDGA